MQTALRVAVLIFSCSASSFAQSTPTASGTQASQLAAKKATLTQVLSGMGISPDVARTLTSVSTGKLTLAGATAYTGDIKIETSGTGKTRSEFNGPNGLVIRIANGRAAAISRPNEKPRKISPSNSIFEGVKHLPALSLLASAANGDADLVDSADSNTFVVAPAAAQIQSKDLKSVQDIVGRKFDFNPATGQITGLSYLSYSDDGVTKIRIRIDYSDYRIVGGVAVPFKQQTYVDGVLRSEVQLETVQFNVALPSTDFDLPEVK